MSKQVSLKLKKEVIKRDGGICQICGKQSKYAHEHSGGISVVECIREGFWKPYKIFFEIDHIVPRFMGGKDEVENLRLTCQNCNRTRHYNEVVST